MTTTHRLAAFGATLALLAGCTTGAVKQDAAATVEQRAVQRWNYLIAHQAEKAWDYLSPGFRATTTREAYAAKMNTRPVQWKSVKYTGGKCEVDRCVVTLTVGYSMLMSGAPRAVAAQSPQQENWVRVRGNWYFLPSN